MSDSINKSPLLRSKNRKSMKISIKRKKRVKKHNQDHTANNGDEEEEGE